MVLIRSHGHCSFHFMINSWISKTKLFWLSGCFFYICVYVVFRFRSTLTRDFYMLSSFGFIYWVVSYLFPENSIAWAICHLTLNFDIQPLGQTFNNVTICVPADLQYRWNSSSHGSHHKEIQWQQRHPDLQERWILAQRTLSQVPYPSTWNAPLRGEVECVHTLWLKRCTVKSLI